MSLTGVTGQALELVALIGALEDENERLLAERDQLRREVVAHPAVLIARQSIAEVAAVEAERDELRAEVERLRVELSTACQAIRSLTRLGPRSAVAHVRARRP